MKYNFRTLADKIGMRYSHPNVSAYQPLRLFLLNAIVEHIILLSGFLWKHPYTVNIGFRNHPPSEGSRFLNPARPLKQGSGYSNQVVTGRAKRVLFLFPLGLATTTATILLYKSQILRFLNPRLLFIRLFFWTFWKKPKAKKTQGSRKTQGNCQKTQGFFPKTQVSANS